MPKRLDVLLVFLLFGALSFAFVVNHFVSRSTQFSLISWAQKPQSVGNKPAPIPILDVEEVSLTNERNMGDAAIRRSINSAVGGRNLTPKYDLKEFEMSWLVSVEDGSLVPMKALVFIPQGADNQRFPVIVYGPGSTGLADRCAPSRENLNRGNMGNYRNYMIAEASQGYIVIMPNYEGFDNPDRGQHYFNKDSEARSMLSSAQALIRAANNTYVPMNMAGIFFGGYSQGGHAAFSAADYAEAFAPDLPIAGVFAHGPTTDINWFLINNPNLAAYFVASYSDYYPAINPDVILEPEWIGYLDRARTLCVDEGFGINSTTYDRVFADQFANSLRNNRLARDFPDIHQVFEENDSGTGYRDIPTLIVQGTGDPIVTNEAQNTFVEQLCARGVPVQYQLYPGVHHFSTRQVSFNDTNAWINAITNGSTPPDNCGVRAE